MGETEHRENRLLGVAAAAIWLIFLVFPISGGMQREPEPAQWAGLVVGLTVFSAAYLVPFADIRALRKWSGPRLGITVSLVMVAGAALAVPASDFTVIYLAPYLVALWCFTQELRIGLTVSVLVVLVAMVVAAVVGGDTPIVWRVLPLAVSSLPIVGMALVVQREDQILALREQVRAARQREAIARDVHDVLGHSLTVVAVKTELARRLVHLDAARAEAELDDVLRLTRESLVEVRATVGGLRTPDVTEQIAAARTALTAAGIRARIDVVGEDGADDSDGLGAIPVAQREVFAWCLRESVTNVVRHSGARRCIVALGPGRLVVEDDGRGPGAAGPAAGGPGDGNGLTGMRERVAQIGGTLTVGPARGSESGTRVEVTA